VNYSAPNEFIAAHGQQQGSIAGVSAAAPSSAYREEGHSSSGATPRTGRFLRRIENQSDESYEIAPAKSLPAANATAATAQQSHFLMRCRRSYSLCKSFKCLRETVKL
jgi:hypothetical protein